jgi:solute carrier family 25 iron transporter 28/37
VSDFKLGTAMEAELKNLKLGTAMEAEMVERKELKRTDTSSFRHHAIAGSFAGVAEHVSVFPIDTIKTHVQAQRSATAPLTWSSDLVLARTLVTQHGVGSLWRGVGVAASACGPAHALMFTTYEHVLTLGGQESAGADRAAVVGAVAGGVSTLAHDLVMELGYYRSAFHCLSRMLATGGGSLYRSLPTTLAMNVPYASLMMMANEGARKVVNPSGEYSLTTFLLCGGFSGAFAAALTTPLDVVKTRLQTQGLGVGVEAAAEAAAHDAPSAFTVRYSGFVDAATALWRCDGFRGFFRGATPRVLMYGPACAISWVAYEGAKKAIVDAGF